MTLHFLYYKQSLIIEYCKLHCWHSKDEYGRVWNTLSNDYRWVCKSIILLWVLVSFVYFPCMITKLHDYSTEILPWKMIQKKILKGISLIIAKKKKKKPHTVARKTFLQVKLILSFARRSRLYKVHRPRGLLQITFPSLSSSLCWISPMCNFHFYKTVVSF